MSATGVSPQRHRAADLECHARDCRACGCFIRLQHPAHECPECGAVDPLSPPGLCVSVVDSVRSLVEGRVDRGVLAAEQAAARERVRQARKPDAKPTCRPNIIAFPTELLKAEAEREEAMLENRRKGVMHQRDALPAVERRRRDDALSRGGNGTRIRSFVFAHPGVTTTEIAAALDMEPHVVINYMPALLRTGFVTRTGEGLRNSEFRYTSTEDQPPEGTSAPVAPDALAVALVHVACTVCNVTADRVLGTDRRAMTALARWLVYDELLRRDRDVKEVAAQFGVTDGAVYYGRRVIEEYAAAGEDNVALFRTLAKEVRA